ncbi:MAG: Gfo/Idh/MocA family oxidoreductase [Candidatus Latescibacteria bacterium]|nr:Gfo/Idh/MocA family oxidoreductase [Candidatus Latescibacterota bacterium]
MPLSRRSFIGTVSAVSAGTIVGNTKKSEAAQNPASIKPIRIGVLTCHPTHHHMPNIWGPLIQCIPRNGFLPTRMTGMILTHIWDYNKERVDSYCKQFGTKPVKKYDDMLDKVDGVIISDMRNSDYFPELAEPYLKAGVPVLFNRPFTSNIGNCKRIIASSKKHGTPFMTASGWEYCKEVYAMRKQVEYHGPEIKAVTATNSSTEITHDVHGVWIICAMIGPGIESVSVNRNVQSVYEEGNDTWSIYYKEREDRSAFYATLHNQTNHESNASVRVQFTDTSFEQALWYLSGDTEQRYQYYFLPPLLEFQRMIGKGTMPQSHEVILEKTAVFLAGFKSHLDYGGKPVKLSELEDDYTVQSDPNPITYPEGFFG